MGKYELTVLDDVPRCRLRPVLTPITRSIDYSPGIPSFNTVYEIVFSYTITESTKLLLSISTHCMDRARSRTYLSTGKAILTTFTIQESYQTTSLELLHRLIRLDANRASVTEYGVWFFGFSSPPMIRCLRDA